MAGRIVQVDTEDLKRPKVAWPTVCLWLVVLLALPFSIRAGWHNPWLFMLPTAALIFMAFTPMHDAVHMAVSTDYRWLNGLIGRVCAAFYFAPFPAFRFVHLQHHKHTNHKDLDPDYWSGLRPVFLTPLRWFSQEYHYYVPWFKEAVKGRFSTADVIEVVVGLVGSHALLVYVCWLTSFRQVFLAYMLPMRLAVCFLAYTFDYIPHRPHQVSRATDPYKCTSRVKGLTHVDQHVPLSVVLLYQNYHNIHHLWPSIPFYRYAMLWRKHKKELLAAGTPVAPLYDPNRPWL